MDSHHILEATTTHCLRGILSAWGLSDRISATTLKGPNVASKSL